MFALKWLPFQKGDFFLFWGVYVYVSLFCALQSFQIHLYMVHERPEMFLPCPSVFYYHLPEVFLFYRNSSFVFYPKRSIYNWKNLLLRMYHLSHATKGAFFVIFSDSTDN